MGLSKTGDWWLTVDQEAKEAFVEGFRGGLVQGYFMSVARIGDEACEAKDDASHRSLWTEYFAGVETWQFVEAVDKLFEDPQNRFIPAYFAVWHVAHAIAGLPQSELDEKIRELRRAEESLKRKINN